MQQSLFEPMGEIVLAEAAQWIAGVVRGEVAVVLCVIAVALVGMAMLTGRLALRQGVQVALGCFILLGAPVIAGGLLQIIDSGNMQAAPPTSAAQAPIR
jgi:type IV secretion system protein VirB2